MNGETLCFSTFHHSSSIHVSLLKVSVRFSSIHVNFCKVYGHFLTAYRQRRLPLGPCTEVLTGDRTRYFDDLGRMRSMGPAGRGAVLSRGWGPLVCTLCRVASHGYPPPRRVHNRSNVFGSMEIVSVQPTRYYRFNRNGCG